MVIDKTDDFVAKIALNMRKLDRKEQLSALKQYPNAVQIAVIDALDSMKRTEKRGTRE